MPRQITKKQWTKFVLIVLGFVVLLTGLYLRLLSVRDKAIDEEDRKVPAPVRTIGIKKEDVVIYKSVLGRVEGSQTVTVFTEVSGWVKEIRAERGDRVNKDEVLLVLEDQKTGLSMSEAEGRLNSARAQLRESQRQYEQNKKLFEKGIIARDTLESSLNQLRSNESTVNSLEASYRIMKWEYEQLSVRSPIEGRVIEIIPDVGQELQVNERAARVVNSQEKKVMAGVDASMAKVVSEGTEVKIHAEKNGEEILQKGYVTGISEDVDENSSLYSLEVRMAEESGDLLPGEIVTLEIPVQKLEGVVKVPVTSVYSDNDHYYIYVAKDNTAVRIKIDDVKWINDNFGLIDPASLPEKSRIITEGSAALNDGDQLKLIN